MSEMFLTKPDLESLTKRKQSAAQARVLRAMGIVFKLRADGSLVVLRAHVEAEFGMKQRAAQVRATFEPNWSAMNKGKT